MSLNPWKVKVVKKSRFNIEIVYNVKRGNKAIIPTDIFNQNFTYVDEKKFWAIKSDEADHEQLCKWLLNNGYMIRNEHKSNYKRLSV